MFKKVPGNHNFIVSLSNEIRTANGGLTDFIFRNNRIRIPLYGKLWYTDIQVVALLAHFEFDRGDDLKKVQFVRINPEITGSQCGKFMTFTSPIYVRDKFRLIPGYSKYAISEAGEVLDIANDKIIPHTYRNKEYPGVFVYDPDRGFFRTMLVHRLVAMAWVDNADHLGTPIVNHKDGIKSNCHASNLEWCTYSYNNLHALTLGLKKDGHAHKVRDRQTGEIKEYASFSQVCEALNLDKTTKFSTIQYTSRNPFIHNRYEIKTIDDNSPWAPDTEEDFTRRGSHSITVTHPDGRQEVFHQTSKLMKELKVWNTGNGLPAIIEKAQLMYPGIQFDVKDNFAVKPVQAYQIETGEVIEANSMNDMAGKVGIGSTTIRNAIKIGETHDCKGYAFRFKTEKPWPSEFRNPHAPVALTATNSTTQEVLSFSSMKSAARHFKVDKGLVKNSLINDVPFMSEWMLKETMKEQTTTLGLSPLTP